MEKFKTDKNVNELSFDMNPLAGRQLEFFVKLEAEEVNNLDEVRTHKIFFIRQEKLKGTVLRKYRKIVRN